MVKHHPWMLPAALQAQVSQESAKYVDKGNWYNLLNDHLADCHGKAKEWLSTKQVCELLRVDASKGSVLGKALNQLHKEGRIEKKLKNGYNQYLFPTVTPHIPFQ